MEPVQQRLRPLRDRSLNPPLRRAAGVLALSALLVVPIFWQGRVQAGDLSSHVYNAWLAQQIEEGGLDGLRLEWQWTNVLTDVVFLALARWLGFEAAQRLLAAGVVLIFFWGSFAFVAGSSGRRPWRLLPVLSMLSHGCVFQLGLINYYTAAGLALAAMALLWRVSWRRVAGGTALLAVAWLAHGIPVLIALTLLAYRGVAQRFPPGRRKWLLAASLGTLVAAGILVRRSAAVNPPALQPVFLTGLDQLLVYGDGYFVPFAATLLVWALLMQRSFHQGKLAPANNPRVHLYLLTAGLALTTPAAVLLPGYDAALTMIQERITLIVAVLGVAVIAEVSPRRWQFAGLCAAAVVFFLLLYGDHRRMNAVEDELERGVAQLPAGARVVQVQAAPRSRIDPGLHALDRACLGRCFSYGNYEPASGAFRVRVGGPNAYVVERSAYAEEIKLGTYRVRPGDLPLYVFSADTGGRITVRAARAGESLKEEAAARGGGIAVTGADVR